MNCERGSLLWRQEESEKVIIRLTGEPERTYWRGDVRAKDSFLKNVPAWLLKEWTIPSGHAEAFHDAFARLHREFEKDVRLYNEGRPFVCDGSRYASVHDGLKHMKFIEAAVRSAKSNSRPVKL